MTESPAAQALEQAREAWLRPPRAVTDGLAAWCADGGSLALQGGTAAARRRLLDEGVERVRAANEAVLRISGLRRLAWSAVELALADPSLAGPPAALPDYRDASRRAQATAQRLVARSKTPLWVVADDLEQVDAPSQRVLALLAAAPDVHVLVSTAHPPAWTHETLTLPSWTAQELQDTVGATLGAPLDRSVCADLVASAAGQPTAVVDLLERVLRQGLLDPSSGTWARRTPSLHRLRRASSEDPTGDEKRVLQALALLCLPVRPERLGQILGLTTPQVVRACTGLEERGLVRRTEGHAVCTPGATGLGPGTAEARGLHEAVVKTLADAQVPRAWLVPHLTAAKSKALAQRWAEDALTSLSRRDAHAAAAIAEDLWALAPGLGLARVGIRALADARRPAEALAFSERVLAQRSGTRDAPADRAAVYAESARLHLHHLGDTGAVRDLLRTARRCLGERPPPLVLLVVEAQLHAEKKRHERTLTSTRGRHPMPPRTDTLERSAWLALHILAARALAATQKLSEAVERLQTEAEAEGCVAEERERLWVEAAQLSWRAGHFLAAADAYEAAARIDRTTHGADAVAWMERAGTGRYQAGDRQAAIETWTRALKLARRTGAAPVQARIQVTLCSVLREVCRFQEAANHGQAAFDGAKAVGSSAQAINAAMAMGDLGVATQNLDQATTWFARCGQLVEREDLPRARGRLARRWAELAVLQHDPRGATVVANAIALANRAELPRDAARATVLKAVLSARAGRVEQVEAVIARATRPLVKQGAIRTLAEVRLWAAEAWLAAGDPKRAVEEAAHAVVWADEVGHLLFRDRADALTAQARSTMQAATPDQDPTDLERLLDMAVSLGRVRDLSTLLREVAHAARHLVGADRAFVVLGDPKNWHVAARSCADGHEQGEPSHSVVRRTLVNNAEVAIQNVEERNDLREQDSIVHLQLRSAWCFPLFEGDRTLGALYADSQGVNASELLWAQRLLRALASQASVAVTNARLLAESQQRAEEAADIAHDMRSPLSSVVMASEQLAELADLPDWVQDVLGEMTIRVRGVLEMAESFLDERPSRRRLFDLTSRVDRLAGLASRSHRHLRRSVSFESTGPAQVLADPETLDRALNNLIDNALKHTPSGTRVQVRVLCRNGSVDVIVRDQGPGIPEHLLPRLFERGEKGSTSQGYGLGLNIARRLAEENGGTLHAHNPPDGGAQFTLSLPLSREQDDRSALDSLV